MEEEEDDKKKATSLVGIKKEPKLKCSLDSRTQLLMKLIFNDDMFMDQMSALNLDVKKMPLGKLSKTQILKGLEVLIDIEKELNGKRNHQTLQNLSSKFYTVVPHSFGRSVPPVINLLSIVDQKKDMMMTLTDIEIAQSLQKEKIEDQSLHPIDMNYQKMGCKLEHIDSKSEDFKMIQKYATACKNTRAGKLLDVWEVDRPSQVARFSQHDDIKYRKLLWHGTNVAVVAAILKAGLRIMPHSGGLVGKGIYFASEHAKSSWYVGAHHGTFEGEKNIGFMFLTEVALGKMNFIKQVSSGLTAPPKGFDSVVARGKLEPDPKKDIKKEFEGHDVIVPVGAPVPQKEFKDSNFTQSEYLVYKESQARIRYLLKFSF
ncbi:UNVERIFIED_CONTAM: hypothetical protein GTU68_062313, partial [Idotea baltica]|nr:hypothetical protein [Idotea baltica]